MLPLRGSGEKMSLNSANCSFQITGNSDLPGQTLVLIPRIVCFVYEICICLEESIKISSLKKIECKAANIKLQAQEVWNLPEPFAFGGLFGEI